MPRRNSLLSRLRHGRAWDEWDEKKLPEAIEHFGKTILLNPDFEQAYYDLAVAQINLNKTSDALATGLWPCLPK